MPEAGFVVLHSHHLEQLRDVLVHLMRQQPLPPLENDIVLVQSNGMAQWLQAALAADPPAGLGVCAAVEMMFPARFQWQLYRQVLGEAAVPRQSPLAKSQLRWRLLRLLPDVLEQPVFAPLARYLASDASGLRRWQLAVQLADLFDQYQVYRADWLQDWAAGTDRLTEADLPSEEAWQPVLWRLLLADLATEGVGSDGDSLTRIHARFLAALQAAVPGTLALPPRVVVWGFSTLPVATLQLLSALGRHVQVVLAVVNPCRHYWADLRSLRPRLRHARKADLPSVLAEHELSRYINPLLLAWGRQGQDYLLQLEQLDDPDAYRGWLGALGQRIDIFEVDEQPSTLLAQMQEAIRDLQPLPPMSARLAVSAADRSLRFQVAHTRLREVEALHDELLHAFAEAEAAGRPLHPRDVVVMVPDIRDYAPLFQAVFGRPGQGRLPYVILDRPQRGESPLLKALDWLLQLPEQRCTAPEIWDLLDVPAVQRRFGLQADQLVLLRDWFERAGARWGLDAAHRASFDLPADLSQNSWRFALDRLLLGYAVGHDPDLQPFADVLPLPLPSALEAAALGPMQLLLAALDDWRQRLAQPQPATVWWAWCRELLDDFFALPVDDPDGLLFRRIEAALVEWQQEVASVADALPALSLPVVREAWLSRLDESGLSQRFLSGAIHVATLMPMRAIPFRKICLLGLNDGDFPRQRPPVDFDLMQLPGQRRSGDRSRRDDDRYLFLEALLSARESLLLSWVGRDVRSNQPRPPSLLLAQLRDYLEQGWVAEAGQQAGASPLPLLTLELPLQPFSRAYFDGTRPALFTYASDWRSAHDSPPPASRALPAEAPGAWTLTLAQWQQQLANPSRLLYSERLGVRFFDEVDELPVHEPFDHAGLVRYQFLQTALTCLPDWRDGGDIDTWLDRQQGQGQWPLAGFADPVRQHWRQELQQRWQQAQPWLQLPAMAGRLLSWQDVRAAGQLQVQDQLSLLRLLDGAPVQLLLPAGRLFDSRQQPQAGKWLSLALTQALSAAAGQPLRQLVVTSEGVWSQPGMTATQAQAWLTACADLWWQARQRAPAFEWHSAVAWQQAVLAGKPGQKAVTTVYEGGFQGPEGRRQLLPLAWLWPDAEALLVDGELAGWAGSCVAPVLDWLASGDWT